MNDSDYFQDTRHSATRQAAYAVVLVAVGVALAPFTSFPVGIARVNPTQHFVNVIAAVLIGPWWATGIAGIIGVIRNALGVGTFLAFPGGMIGALCAGGLYRLFRKVSAGAAGEVIGTGFIAPVVSALWVAPALMGRNIGFLALFPSFLASSLVGAVSALFALRFLRRAGIVSF